MPRFLFPNDRLRGYWPWLPLWWAAALWVVFSHGPIPLHSTRTLSVAWEMWQQHSFLVPILNGVPYSDKVPLLYWLIHLGWAVGGVGDTWPRLLMVLIGSTQLLLVRQLALRWFPERPVVARIAPWILGAFTYGFLYNLQIMYDGLLAVWVLAALLALSPTERRESPRFLLVSLFIGLGLLTKGPVMLLHVALPWLFGVWWHPWARQHPRRWYGLGAVSLLGGLLILLAWVLPAVYAGGAAYRNALLFHQTAGRVVDAFAHAHAWWWYLPVLPLLLFPFILWPRFWVGLTRFSRPLEPGMRMLLGWLLPVLLAFSVVSGKQAYYLTPELAGFALLIALTVARGDERMPGRGSSAWLGPWPLALFGLLLGGLLLGLPELAAAGQVSNRWLLGLVPQARPLGMVLVLLGGYLFWPGWGEAARIAMAGLLGVVAANAMFTSTLWKNFDLSPVAAVLRQASLRHQPIANLGLYEGQFHYLARLNRPIVRLYEGHSLQTWAAAHPRGLVLTYPLHLSAAARQHAQFIQPFRGVWVVVWKAPLLAAWRAGHSLPASPPAQIWPPGVLSGKYPQDSAAVQGRQP